MIKLFNRLHLKTHIVFKNAIADKKSCTDFRIHKTSVLIVAYINDSKRIKQNWIVHTNSLTAALSDSI